MTNEHWFVPPLWPGGREESWAPARRGHAERFVAIPSRTDVQQLLPWRWSSAVAAAQRVSDDRSRFSRVRDAAGVVALLGLATATPSRRLGVVAGTSMVGHVASELGIDSPSFGTYLFGPARANRKPVIQIHDRSGRTRAWVKVGTTDLTRALLSREVEVLTDMREPSRGFRVPRVIGRGSFGATDWAALEPMSVDRRHRPDLPAFDDVARSIERSAPRWSGPVDGSPLVQRLTDEAAGLELSPSIVDRLARRGGAIVLAAAHGDLVPWNMLSGTPEVAVWDWERYETTAPVGFDRIHRRIQVAVQQRGRTLEAAVAEVETDLRAHDDLPAESWSTHVDWYLAAMLCRYERDARRHANPRLVGRIQDLARVLIDRGAPT